MPWPAEATAQRALSQTQKHPLAGTSRPRPPTPTGACPRPPPRLTPGRRGAARRGTRPGSRSRQPAAPVTRAIRPAPAPAPQTAPAPAQPDSAPAPAAAAPERPLRPGARQSQPPASSRPAPPEAAGSYAYPDDDWGPPRDEDAPPLDEEPPMDWDPSAPAVPRSARPAAEPAPSRQGRPPAGRTSTASQASPATARLPRRRTPPTTRGPVPLKQAPGIWAVGTDSNVGSYRAGGVRVTRADAGAGTAALRTRGGPGPALRRSSVVFRRI